MRIALKLTLAITFAILAVLATNSFIRVKRELALFDEDMRRDGRVFGRALAGAAARSWSRVGAPEAIDMIRDANEREAHMQLRWVWLDAPAGDPLAPIVPGISTRPGEATTIVWHPPHEETEVLYTYFPVAGPEPRRAAIELRESLAAERAYIRATLVQASVATAVLVVISGLLTLGLGVLLVGRPIRRIVEHARRVGEGDLASRLHPRRRDEIGVLALEMNAMSERLAGSRERLEAATASRVAAVEQLRHADRLATVGRLAAGIAHEIGTPLNVITGYAQLIADDAAPASADHARTIAQQAQRVAEIVRQLLDFARQRPVKLERQDLTAVAKTAVELLAQVAQKQGVQLDLRADDGPVWAMLDRLQLQQVLANLVVNAIHASPRGVPVELRTERRTVTPPAPHGGPTRSYACVIVRDVGTGISPDVLPRIFEPFFTTKDVGEGTGLGLPVAYGIIHEHGGWIDVTSEVGRGTCFTVYLAEPADEADPDRR